MWFYKRSDVTVSPNDVINIEASKRITGSVLAFDDIQLQNQACESPGWCDFENGKPYLFYAWPQGCIYIGVRVRMTWFLKFSATEVFSPDPHPLVMPDLSTHQLSNL